MHPEASLGIHYRLLDRPHGDLDVKRYPGHVPAILWTNQPSKTGLTSVSASAVHQLPHGEAFWVTHSALCVEPLTMSEFTHATRCPTAPCIVEMRQQRHPSIASC